MADIEKNSRYQRAISGLRDRILIGDLAKGTRLSEVALAEELGISRTPLREAMRELVEQGLLERLPAGGCRVVSFSRRDVMDTIELRGVLEGAAFRMAAEQGATRAGVQSCTALIKQIDDALGPSEAEINFARYVTLNEELHLSLAGLCHSTVLRTELAKICQRPLAGPSAFLGAQATSPPTRRSFFVAQEQHRAILDAIVNREGARAEALAREHARLALRNLDIVLSAGPNTRDQVPGITLVEITPERKVS
ncbi:GntR family transcriptional regulator [Puniceibacterium sp. IMCC21224]|uniref:GntR family transcriptional regulator n=1 Tax=Puniceibacterium sp. IMCC21224 TaxID=1618204 RepID=UPI00064DCC63|nr:GntR family transcriptional regulator [Puniceibacterium sp. IMCC21224]KMK68022.1 transcriptional regulator [Puniceibacterium sp. IMCC21224]